MNKLEKKDEPILKAETKKEIQQLNEEFFTEGGLGRNPEAPLQGFRYFDAKYITISPEARTMEIIDPGTAEGIEEYRRRDMWERAQLVGDDVRLLAQRENEIFDGVRTRTEYRPEIGGRICLSVLRIFRTSGGDFASVSILPEEERNIGVAQKYAGNVKLNAQLLRSPKFPKAKHVLNAALNRESHNLTELQSQMDERIAGRSHMRDTGFWNVNFARIVNSRKVWDRLKNCYIQRDPETGTFEVFLVQEEFVFQDFDKVVPRLNIEPEIERVNMLVDFKKLKQVREGEPLEVEKLFLGGEEIRDFEKIPKNYQNTFEQKDGRWFVKDFKAVPPLRAVLKLENRIIEPIDRDVENDIREKIGELFEKMMVNILQRETGGKSGEEYKVELPDKKTLQNLVKNQPQEFQDWAMKLKGKEIVVVPDFVLEDGTFVEMKAGGKMEFKPKKRDQLFRMILYKLLKGEEMKVRILTLEKTSQDPAFENIRYENVFETEWGPQIAERDIKPIRMWQKYLSK